jgi:hypothetical protein
VSRSPSTLAFVALSATLLCGTAEAQEWSLFGRHGECAPISSLKRKLQDMPEIRTPDEFSVYLDSKRLKYTRQAHQAGASAAVGFEVPDAGLAIVFVHRQQCSKAAPAGR